MQVCAGDAPKKETDATWIEKRKFAAEEALDPFEQNETKQKERPCPGFHYRPPPLALITIYDTGFPTTSVFHPTTHDLRPSSQGRLPVLAEPPLRVLRPRPRTLPGLLDAALDAVINAHAVLEIRTVDYGELGIDVIGMMKSALARDVRLDNASALGLEAAVVGSMAPSKESSPAGLASGRVGIHCGAVEPGRVCQTLCDEGAQREHDNDRGLSE